jgi:hypothetical protein
VQTLDRSSEPDRATDRVGRIARTDPRIAGIHWTSLRRMKGKRR